MSTVGFTGTRSGMTEYQKAEVFRHLTLLKSMSYRKVRHGDCIGADAEFHEIALKLGYDVEIHPPVLDKYRAYCKGAVLVHHVKPYLVRNQDIVNGSEFMLATPKRMYEELRSGTWAAIRYAVQRTKNMVIVWPEDRQNV